MATILNAEGMDFRRLNRLIKETDDREIVIDCCLGQRYIGAGLSGKSIVINGTPGNALGSYLDGAGITVNANAQDAAGDTMNDGRIVIHGCVGDAVGYAMRGGEIYVKGNAGYRAGIHMKAYRDKKPVIVIGGTAGSFLGEYQAGGTIIVLGLGAEGKRLVGNFPCTGMHGGKLFIRSDMSIAQRVHFTHQVTLEPAPEKDLEEIRCYIERYCGFFGGSAEELMSSPFTMATPDTANPYKQMYVAN